jgi:hypothetical protein
MVNELMGNGGLINYELGNYELRIRNRRSAKLIRE